MAPQGAYVHAEFLLIAWQKIWPGTSTRRVTVGTMAEVPRTEENATSPVRELRVVEPTSHEHSLGTRIPLDNPVRRAQLNTQATQISECFCLPSLFRPFPVGVFCSCLCSLVLSRFLSVPCLFFPLFIFSRCSLMLRGVAVFIFCAFSTVVVFLSPIVDLFHLLGVQARRCAWPRPMRRLYFWAG